MNNFEKKMVEILNDLRQNHGTSSIRAEFESEGTKMEELLRLKEICMIAKVGLNLKIGGCESVRDILEVYHIGVTYLTAPMIESAYALRKYLQAVEKYIPMEERSSIKILCNIETIDAYQNIDDILNIPEIALLNGIVIERVDLCFSLGKKEEEIDTEEISQYVSEIIVKAKKKKLITILGGGLSANSLPFIRKMEKQLDYYETRKICFDSAKALKNQPETGILKALRFELLWLKNKLSFNNAISVADQKRIQLIEQKYENEGRV